MLKVSRRNTVKRNFSQKENVKEDLAGDKLGGFNFNIKQKKLRSIRTGVCSFCNLHEKHIL